MLNKLKIQVKPYTQEIKIEGKQQTTKISRS